MDCNFGGGVSILEQHVPNAAPSLSGDDNYINVVNLRIAIHFIEGSQTKCNHLNAN